MRHEEETNSIAASFYDFCSVGERTQGNREQLLIRENSRLRREHSEISEKYIKMCNQVSKLQAKAIEKEKKLTELDLFYRREIEELKRELTAKNGQLAKLTKTKTKSKGESNKQNRNQNVRTEELESFVENQSIVVNQVQNENVRLHRLIQTAIQLFEPCIKEKENHETLKRVTLLRKELEDKGSMDQILEKSNAIIQQIRSKTAQTEGEFGQMLTVLKSKRNQLKKIPLTFDYDLESESRNLELLLTGIDIQMRLLKPRRNEE